MSAPNSLQMKRKDASVTSSIGARKSGLSPNSMFPIFIQPAKIANNINISGAYIEFTEEMIIFVSYPTDKVQDKNNKLIDYETKKFILWCHGCGYGICGL